MPCREVVCTIFMMVFGMTRPRGELTTYCARGGHATDWANPTLIELLYRVINCCSLDNIWITPIVINTAINYLYCGFWMAANDQWFLTTTPLKNKVTTCILLIIHSIKQWSPSLIHSSENEGDSFLSSFFTFWEIISCPYPLVMSWHHWLLL